MTTDEQIAVLQAYKEGEPIQCRSLQKDTEGNLVYPTWGNCEMPSWDFYNCEYRIKPKPKYRPYKEEELIEEIRKRGNLLKRKDGINVFLSSFDGEVVWICGQSVGLFYKEAMEVYTWQDGTPFGKLEEEK